MSPPTKPPSRAARTLSPSGNSLPSSLSASASGSWRGEAIRELKVPAKRAAKAVATWWPGRTGGAPSSSASGCGSSPYPTPAGDREAPPPAPGGPTPRVGLRGVPGGQRGRAQRHPEEWGDEATCNFWSGNELDERVKRHPDLLKEFFQLTPAESPRALPHNLPFSTLGPLFQGREEMITLLHEKLTQAPAGKAVHGLGGAGKTRLAVAS